VNYTPVAEGSANSSINGAIERQEGEAITLNVTFKNIATAAFQDSILVRQTLFGPAGLPQITERKLRKLAPNEEITYPISLSTIGRVGNNRLIVHFNPRQQPEQNYANNLVNLPFVVVPDRLPPLMEVSFDGQRIKDSDVVSANPTVLVELKDENRFLFKRDTLGIELFLQTPTQNSFRKIALSSSFIKFTPANNQNLARIEYRPNTLPDGLYTLRVQGADASLNRTGVYQISFRVINEQRIVSIEANPNPFRDLLRFQLIISGKEPPTDATISVNDLNGKILKTINFTPRVGTNEWLWQVSPDIPAGTYFYLVSVNKNGQALPLNESTKTTGKILLVR